MRRDVFAKLQRLPVSYFDKRASGDLMTRVVEDINNVERVLIDGTEQGTVAILCIGGISGILFYTNPTLAAVALSPLPFLARRRLVHATAHRRYRNQREASSAMNALLMDDLQGIRQIKAYGRQDHEDARFADRAEGLRQGNLGIMRAWANYNPTMSFFAALGTVLVLWFGGKAVMAGTMTTGELVGFLFYLMLFYEPMARLHGLNQMLQSARAAGETCLTSSIMKPNAMNPAPPNCPNPCVVRWCMIAFFEYESDRRAFRYFPARQTRRNDRAGRPHRRGQKHAREFDARFLRVHGRQRQHRWPKRSRNFTDFPAPPHRRRQSGTVPV